MLKSIKFAVISTFSLLIFVQCTFGDRTDDATKNNAKNTANLENNQAKIAAEKFCKTLVSNDLNSLLLLVDNVSKNSVTEWKNNQVEYFYDTEFIKVDTCILKNGDAFCVCHFTQADIPILDTLQFKKYTSGWLAHLDWNNDHLNPFKYNLSSQLSKEAPSEIPVFNDSIELSDFHTSAEVLKKVVHHPANVIGFLSSETYAATNYDSLYTEAIKVAELFKESSIKKETVTLVFTKSSLTIDYYFNDNDQLFRIKFSFSYRNQNPFAYVHYLAGFLTETYGKPYNAKNIPVSELYKYQELRWFVKSFNEEISLSQDKYGVTVDLLTGP